MESQESGPDVIVPPGKAAQIQRGVLAQIPHQHAYQPRNKFQVYQKRVKNHNTSKMMSQKANNSSMTQNKTQLSRDQLLNSSSIINGATGHQQ